MSMTMRIALAIAALVSQSKLGPSANALEHLHFQPDVQRHAGVLPLSVCKQLIDLGEKSGFLVREESIDDREQRDPNERYVPSQTIDVWDQATRPNMNDEVEIGDEAIWSVLQPWIPKITQVVKDNRDAEVFSKFYPDHPDRDPVLNWVFFRKYSPDDERNSLQHHEDTNMFTLNVELSDAYEGGGLFYIKPLASTGKINREYYRSWKGYKWIDSIKRENTTEYIFPDLRAGDAVFYNYTVTHAVAPVESGTRYSMAFFFDMDNPAVANDFGDLGVSDVDEFEVEVQNGLPDIEFDLIQVLEIAGKEVLDLKFNQVVVGEKVTYAAYEGDRLRALRAGTGEVIADIEIERDIALYRVSRVEPKEYDEDEFEVELHKMGFPTLS